MDNISELLNLDDEEKILAVFETDKKEIDIAELNTKFHKVEDLPRSFFKINAKTISFVNTHVFTNKRYINIGVNFWQLQSIYNLVGNKINIKNYILSIQKEEIQSFKLQLKFSHIGIILSDIIDLWCFSYAQYKSFRKFLIEKWIFLQKNVDNEEKHFSSKLRTIFLGINFLELLIMIILLIGNWLHFFSFSSNFFFTFVLIVMICISIYEMINILIVKKEKFFNYQFWLIPRLWFLISAIGIFFVLLSL